MSTFIQKVSAAKSTSQNDTGRSCLRLVTEDGETQAREHVHDGQQEQQARRDAREPQGVEAARVDAAQLAPPRPSVRGDEEARDDEEHRHRVVAVANHGVDDARTEDPRQQGVVQPVGDVEVVEQDQEDGHAPEQVDPAVAGTHAHRLLLLVVHRS